MYLEDLQLVAASEMSPEEMIYKPQAAALCLETVANLPTNSPLLRAKLSEIHPYLIDAMTNIQKGEGCSTLGEVVEKFPVLQGLNENELERFRRNWKMTPRTASMELLHLRTTLCDNTIDRYFRPTQIRAKIDFCWFVYRP